MVWPESVRPEASVIVTDIITGQADARLVEQDLEGEKRGLGVQRVEDRLDEERVDSGRREGARLLGVGRRRPGPR